MGPALLAGTAVESGIVLLVAHCITHASALCCRPSRIPSKSPSDLYYMQICKIFPFNLIDISLKLVMSSAGIPMTQGDYLSLLGARETYRVAHTLCLNFSACKIGPDLLVFHVSLLEQLSHLEDMKRSLI